MLAVPAAGVDDAAIGGLDARVADLAEDADLGAQVARADEQHVHPRHRGDLLGVLDRARRLEHDHHQDLLVDRKSTRLNSSHGYISYAVFCLKKKKKEKKKIIQSN